MATLQRIKSLSKQLPANDITLAEKFIAERDFESLLEIVSSDIYLINKYSESDSIPSKYANLDVEALLELRVEIQEYMSYLEVPDNSDEMYD